MELPKTESELQTLIADEVKKATEALETKHNGAIASIRKDYDNKLQKFKDEQKLSEEERAAKLAKEKEDELNAELDELRAFKKRANLEARLEKEKLPKYLANDSRLMSAEDEQFDKVLKEVRKDYEGSLPNGNTHSTVVQTTTRQAGKSDDKGTGDFAETLKSLIS